MISADTKEQNIVSDRNEEHIIVVRQRMFVVNQQSGSTCIIRGEQHSSRSGQIEIPNIPVSQLIAMPGKTEDMVTVSLMRRYGEMIKLPVEAKTFKIEQPNEWWTKVLGVR